VGRKQTGKGKYLPFHAALIVTLFFSGCTFFQEIVGERVQEKMVQGQTFRSQGKFEQSLQVFQEILSAYPHKPPGDQALREIALTLSHPGNPRRNFPEALAFWWKLQKNFPQSPYGEEARAWIGLSTAYADALRKEEKTKSQLQQAKTQMENYKTQLENCKTQLEELRSDPRLLMADLLSRNQKLWAQNDYGRALEENQAVLAKYGHKPPADEALFALGFTYIQANFPKNDYQKAIFYFKRLLKEIPHSLRAEEARAWVQILELWERSKQIDLEIERKRKQFRK
jgi:tetratricopeptide (TPR) repeat protein